LYHKIEVSDAKALFRITFEEKNKTSPKSASLTHFPGNKKTSKTSVLPAGRFFGKWAKLLQQTDLRFFPVALAKEKLFFF